MDFPASHVCLLEGLGKHLNLMPENLTCQISTDILTQYRTSRCHFCWLSQVYLHVCWWVIYTYPVSLIHSHIVIPISTGKIQRPAEFGRWNHPGGASRRNRWSTPGKLTSDEALPLNVNPQPQAVKLCCTLVYYFLIFLGNDCIHVWLGRLLAFNHQPTLRSMSCGVCLVASFDGGPFALF